MRRCNEWSIDVQADAYKCGQGAAWVLAALRMSNARITFFLRVLQFLLRGCKDPGRPCHAELRFKYLPECRTGMNQHSTSGLALVEGGDA